MAATTSTSCSSFWTNLRSGGPRSRASPVGCGGKLEGIATWLINGLASAFFASLERCSCVRVTTVEDGEDVNELALIYDDGCSSTTSIRRRGGRRKKADQGYSNSDVSE